MVCPAITLQIQNQKYNIDTLPNGCYGICLYVINVTACCVFVQVANVPHLLQCATPARLHNQGQVRRTPPQSHHSCQGLWYALTMPHSTNKLSQSATRRHYNSTTRGHCQPTNIRGHCDKPHLIFCCFDINKGMTGSKYVKHTTIHLCTNEHQSLHWSY